MFTNIFIGKNCFGSHLVQRKNIYTVYKEIIIFLKRIIKEFEKYKFSLI